jgi:hypothetical protein
MFPLALGAVAVASAAEIGLVGVHDAGLTLEEQRRLAERIALSIDRVEGHEVLLPDELLLRYLGREDLILQEALAFEGRKMVEDGRLLYQQAELEDAAAVLEGGVRSLEQSVAVTRSVRELWEAYMLLATARLGAGLEPAARDALADAVALQPGRRPDPAVFPPSILELYEEERELAEGDAAALTIQSPVPGARVWVDGRDVGAAPVVVPGLMPGLHHVHLRAGEQVGYVRVDLQGGAPSTIAPKLGAPALGSSPRSAGLRTQSIAQLYESIGRFAGVDVLVLVGTLDDVWEVQLFHPATDTFGAPVVLDTLGNPDAIADAAERLVRGLRPDGSMPPSATAFAALPLDVSTNALLAANLLAPVIPEPEAMEPTEPGPRAPAPEVPVADKPKWPVWLGVGLGVVAAGAGATALGVVLGGREEPAGGTIVIGPPVR